jgi:hypothetical protein
LWAIFLRGAVGAGGGDPKFQIVRRPCALLTYYGRKFHNYVQCNFKNLMKKRNDKIFEIFHPEKI